MKKALFSLLAAAIAAAVPVHAATFVKDVMLIGGSKSKTTDLKSQYQAEGWTVVNKDLNAGASGDYIYLLYKPEADTDPGSDRDYVTGFYIKSGSSGVTDTLVSGGKTYTLTPYDGDNHFKSQKGDLNSGTGDGSASIHLYYTKAVAGGKAVSGIVFNDEQSGAVGENGGSTGYDLNEDAGGDYIYMHVTTAFVTYGIYYDLAGGTNAGGNPATYTVNTATFSLSDPTRNSYTFAGWTWSGQNTPTKSVTITQGSTGNKSFTAHWTPVDYTISYTLNNGTLPSGYPTTYNIESAVTLVNPTRSHYTFAGWTWSGQSTPQTSVTIPAGSTGNRSYTANWTPTPYTITYKLNNGTLPSGTSNPDSYTIESANFTLVNPTRTGYTFAGWTWSGQSTPQMTVTISRGSTGNRTYTANWTPVTYTITYDLDYGTLPSGIVNPTSYTIESALIGLNNPTRNCYTFAGWTGTGHSTPTKTVTIPRGSTGDRSYTAHWTPVTYTIDYELDGGTLPSGHPTTYNIESAAVTLVNPTRSHYTFAGWTWSGQNTPRTSVTIPTGSSGDKTYTAHWTPVTYNISYSLDGGTLPSGHPTSYNIESASFTLANPTRDYYAFAGWTWSGQTTPQTTVNIPHGSTGDKSYTANWRPAVYSIRFDANGGAGSMPEQTGLVCGVATNLDANAFTRLGHDFAGWSTAANGAAAYANGASVSNLAATDGAVVTLYAVWDPTPWQALQNALDAGGTVTLARDVPSTANDTQTLTVSGTVTLDLAGYTITGRGDNAVVLVQSGGDLTLTNSVPSSGAITGSGYCGVRVYGAFRLRGGEISGNGNRNSSWGGGVAVLSGGSLKMTGGAIRGNTAYDGGGVCVSGGTATMSGGTISENTANRYGGGAYLASGGTFSMTGGAISGNSVPTGSGGGVSVLSGSTFAMSGGEISGNGAFYYGGGVDARGGTFAMSGGAVSGNSANNCGGGVSAFGGSFTMDGGAISGNHAYTQGGGAWAYDGGTITMNAGEISGNDSDQQAGGVSVYLDGAFTMNGGAIRGNRAGTYAGGVCVDGAFEMNGGEISGNCGPNGGVYVDDDDAFTVAGASAVFGNTNSVGEAKNVWLFRNTTFSIGTNGLAAGASIGVTAESSAYFGSPRVVADGATAGDGAYFFSDDPGYHTDDADGAVRLVYGPAPAQLSGAGTPEAPYLIASADDWNAFADNVNWGYGVDASYRLVADVSGATGIVGWAYYPFSGVFDGGGHTLGVAIEETGTYDSETAPFRCISGATISNLVVSGTVTGRVHCAGLVGYVSGGTNLIENCLVSATIAPQGTSYCAGFVGHGDDDAVATLAGCAFTGTFATDGTGLWAGSFWGELGQSGSAAVTLVDCFEQSASSEPVSRVYGDALRTVNVYFDGPPDDDWPDENRGSRAWAVRRSPEVLIDFGEPVATYGASGIVAYGPGIAFGGVFYAGEGETVALSLAATEGEDMVFTAVEGAVLAKNGEGWTLTMPASDVDIWAAPAERYAVTVAPVANARADGYLLVNGTGRTDFTAVEGASVQIGIGGTAPNWTIGSVSVVAAGGAAVPCTLEAAGYGYVLVSFTMPDSPVVVTPVVVDADYPALRLGENVVAAGGLHVFVAPANAVYSFVFADDLSGAQPWLVGWIFDETGFPLVSPTGGEATFVTLAAGSTNYVELVAEAGSGAGLLEIAKVEDAAAYPVSALPAEHGTVGASRSAAPAGGYVHIVAAPDPGWKLDRCFAVDSNGDELDVMYDLEGIDWIVRMPAGPISVWATFVRSYDLVVGENPVLLEYGARDFSFVAPEDGWYRFSMTNAAVVPFIEIQDASGSPVEFDCDYYADGRIDGIVRLERGTRYVVEIASQDHLHCEKILVIGVCGVHAIETDGNVSGGRVSVLDGDGNPAVEALEGSRVYLAAEPDDDREFGGWTVVDEAGGSISPTWDDNEGVWFFRMPGTNVVVSAIFGGRFRVRFGSTPQACFNGIYVNGILVSRYGDYAEVVAGAEVELTYRLCPGWGLSSVAVTTAAGESVPWTASHASIVFDTARVRFRMPASEVAVATVPERLDCPELVLGANGIPDTGTWNFVAPTSGVYSFRIDDPNDWFLSVYDDGGTYLGEIWRGDSVQLPLAAGIFHVVLLRATATGATTVTVSRVGDADTYPVVVVPPAAGGTVEASAAAAPTNSYVYFTLSADRGWKRGSVSATDPDGASQVWPEEVAPGTYRVRMPAFPLVFEATFERSYDLVLGENPILFESGMPECSFIAPEDGWYRFRTTCGEGLSGFYVRGYSCQISCDNYVYDENGDFDGVAWMDAGSECRLWPEFDAPDAVEASIVVSRCTPHAVVVDGNIAHGRIFPRDWDGDFVDEATDGTRIFMEVQPDDGYALAGWNVVDATGAPVDMQWYFDDMCWFFLMPATDVVVSATFGTARSVTLDSDTRIAPYGLSVGGAFGYYWGSPADAAPGSEIVATYWISPGWTVESVSVATADGEPVPCDWEIDRTDYDYASVRFTMPDGDVVVAPVPARADCPLLHVGDNEIPSDGIWDFVAPTSGVYSFVLDDPWDWRFELFDDFGTIIDGNAYGSLALAEDEIVHAVLEGSDDGLENVLTITRTGDAVAHSVVISAEHATVEAPGAEAFEGRNFLFRIVPDPGWRVVGVVATDADGTELELELWGGRYVFTIPASAVTVTATVGPPLPWYLDDADDEVVENYDDWSARYAPDPAGTNLVAFLLDIDPATEIPAGAAPLKVTSFLVDGPIVRFELGSDIADLEVKTGALRGSEPTCYVGNGVLVLSSGEDLSSTNEWTSVPLYVSPGENGRVVGEHMLELEIEIEFGGGGLGGLIGGGFIGGGGSGGLIGFGSPPPSGFFRPALSTRLPPDYGQK